MNKKGAKLLSGWMFLIWVIVALAIVGGVGIFYNQSFDVRGLEIEAMENKVENCLSNEDVFGDVLEGNFDLSQCGFEKSLFEDNSNYFVKIDVNDKSYEFGNLDFEKQCKIKEGILKAKNYPICLGKELFVFYNEEKYVVRILTASNVEGGRNE